MPELSQVLAIRTRAIPIKDADGTTLFNITVVPDRFDRAVLVSIQGNGDPKQWWEIADKLVVPLVTWDLTDNGAPYAVTAANFVALGLPLMKAIWNEVNTVIAFLAANPETPSEVSGASSSTQTSPKSMQA